jgi:lipoprotein-anchoring transpeptidase ErfK/SrfK
MPGLPHASATPTPTGSSPTATPTNPLPTASPSPTPTDTAPPCAPTARACVDLSANRSWLLRDGRVTDGPVPITHGRKGFRTPAGTFRVAFKNRDHVSSIYDAEMPYSVFFNGGVAFHEGSLSVLSHGCIHLSPAAARTWFDTLSVGDVVQVVP